MNENDYPPTTLTAEAVTLQQGASFYEAHKNEPQGSPVLGVVLISCALAFVLLSNLLRQNRRANTRRVTP